MSFNFYADANPTWAKRYPSNNNEKYTPIFTLTWNSVTPFAANGKIRAKKAWAYLTTAIVLCGILRGSWSKSQRGCLYWRCFRFHSNVFFAIDCSFSRSLACIIFHQIFLRSSRSRVCCLHYSLLISCFSVVILYTTDISQPIFQQLYTYIILQQIYLLVEYFKLFSLSTCIEIGK